jgi:hypothetical protein
MAAETFNDGLRGYYFAFAAIGWFFSPIAFIVATVGVVYILYEREFGSRCSDVLTEPSQRRSPARRSGSEGPAVRAAACDLGGCSLTVATPLRCSESGPAEETRYAPSSLRSDSLGESD